MEAMLIEASFRPMGLFFQILSNSQAVIDAAAAAFGGYGVCRPGEPADLHCTLIEIETPDGSVEPRYEVTDAEVRVAFGISGGTRIAVDSLRGEAHGTVAANLVSRPAALRYHVLQFVLATMLAPRGFLGIHAAACVRGGRAILLRGPSGSGKTAVAYACVKAGWQTLGESVVWLDTREGATSSGEVWGMPWYFHFPQGSAALFPELPAEPAIVAGGRERLEIEMESVRRGSTVTRAAPAGVVFLQDDGAPFGPLTRAQAIARWPRGTAGTETDFPGYRRHIGSLLQLPVWELSRGSALAAPGLFDRETGAAW